jgi:hypothetical protein
MKSSVCVILLFLGLSVLFPACKPTVTNPKNSATTSRATSAPDSPAALADEGFKAQINLVEPPQKLRAGETAVVKVKLKNDSPVIWWARGAQVNTRPDNKFYIAAGDRWLKPDGSLLTNMDGRYGISKDLKPGEEAEVPLKIVAPKDPGEYTLEIDLLQEGVSWFHEKGSPTAKTKVSVVK